MGSSSTKAKSMREGPHEKREALAPLHPVAEPPKRDVRCTTFKMQLYRGLDESDQQRMSKILLETAEAKLVQIKNSSQERDWKWLFRLIWAGVFYGALVLVCAPQALGLVVSGTIMICIKAWADTRDKEKDWLCMPGLDLYGLLGYLILTFMYITAATRLIGPYLWKDGCDFPFLECEKEAQLVMAAMISTAVAFHWVLLRFLSYALSLYPLPPVYGERKRTRLFKITGAGFRILVTMLFVASILYWFGVVEAYDANEVRLVRAEREMKKAEQSFVIACGPTKIPTQPTLDDVHYKSQPYHDCLKAFREGGIGKDQHEQLLNATGYYENQKLNLEPFTMNNLDPLFQKARQAHEYVEKNVMTPRAISGFLVVWVLEGLVVEHYVPIKGEWPLVIVVGAVFVVAYSLPDKLAILFEETWLLNRAQALMMCLFHVN